MRLSRQCQLKTINDISNRCPYNLITHFSNGNLKFSGLTHMKVRMSQTQLILSHRWVTRQERVWPGFRCALTDPQLIKTLKGKWEVSGLGNEHRCVVEEVHFVRASISSWVLQLELIQLCMSALQPLYIFSRGWVLISLPTATWILSRGHSVSSLGIDDRMMFSAIWSALSPNLHPMGLLAMNMLLME
jgi:hypothetical protein